MTEKIQVRFQIASDIHLEMPLTLNKMPQIQQSDPKSDILCLLGDICTLERLSTYEQFLNQVTKDFEHVLVLLGNHEYYHYKPKDHSLAEEWNNKLFSKYKNLHFLDRGKFQYKNVVFLGATLWCPIKQEKYENLVEKTISDFKTIFYKEKDEIKVLNSKEINRWHQRDLDFFNSELKEVREDQQVVILTHHPPFFQKQSFHVTQKMDDNLKEALIDCFTNVGMEKLMIKNVKIWAFGHTHFNTDHIEKKSEGKTRVISNQLGYFMKGERTDFKQVLLEL